MADTAILDTVAWVSVGRLERLPLGQGRTFVVDGREIAVFRQRDGRLFAAQGRCPHRRGPLAEGLLGAGKVICPLHAHKFDLAGGAGAEVGECIEIYPVREQAGSVFVGISGERPAVPACVAAGEPAATSPAV
jgi:nitrite reductase (NADH) small subunit